LLILFAMALSVKGLSQDHIKPIVFDNVSPHWQHLVVDSSRLDDEKFLGTKHLWSPTIFIKSGDTIAYYVYVDGSKDLQGGYIEKIDFRTGSVLWHSVFRMSDSGRREFPIYGYINADNELELLCMRNTQDDFFLIWSEGHLAIRQYDLETGHQIAHIYRDDNYLSEDEKLAFFPGVSMFYPIGDKYVYFTPYNGPLFTTYYKEFDLDANLLRSDSLKRDSFYFSGSSRAPFFLRDGRLVYFRHSFNQSVFDTIKEENYDSMRFIVDYYEYNEGLDSLYSLDLSDYLPYNWEINLLVEDDNSLRIICKDSASFYRTRSALVFFNEAGEHIETLDFGRKSLSNLYILKIPYENSSLVFENHNNSGSDNKSIDIWKSDGNGNLELIKKINFVDKRVFRISKVDILGNNDLIVHIVLHTPDPEHKGASLNRVIDVVSISGDEIGLVGTHNIAQIDDDEFDIYPIPCQNKLTLRFKNSDYEKFYIYNSMGKQVMTHLISMNNQTIDIDCLPAGIYTLSVLSKGNIIATKQFVKEK